jgi:hypothetical protein
MELCFFLLLTWVISVPSTITIDKRIPLLIEQVRQRKIPRRRDPPASY